MKNIKLYFPYTETGELNKIKKGAVALRNKNSLSDSLIFGVFMINFKKSANFFCYSIKKAHFNKPFSMA